MKKIIMVILLSIATPVVAEESDQIYPEPTKAEFQCLVKAIYYEASDNDTMQRAVASVVLNRVQSPKFPSTICGVVNQRHTIKKRTVCQFSWVCDKRLKQMVVNSERFNLATAVAHIIYADYFYYANDNDITNGALFFHDTRVRSNSKNRRTLVVDNMRFYR